MGFFFIFFGREKKIKEKRGVGWTPPGRASPQCEVVRDDLNDASLGAGIANDPAPNGDQNLNTPTRNFPHRSRIPTRGVCWMGGRGRLLGGRGWRIQVVWLRTAMLRAPWNRLRGQVALRGGAQRGTGAGVRPHGQNRSLQRTRRPWAPRGCPQLCGAASPPRLCRASPPGGAASVQPPLAWQRSPGQPGPGAERRGPRGDGFFRRAAGALAVQCRLAGQRAGRKAEKGVSGGAGASRRLRFDPQQLVTSWVFFAGDATPPEDTGDIGFC